MKSYVCCCQSRCSDRDNSCVFIDDTVERRARRSTAAHLVRQERGWQAGTAEARKGKRETTEGEGGRVEDENGPGVEEKGDATGKVNGPIRGCCGATLEGDGTLGDSVPNEWSRVGPTKIRGTHLALWNESLPLHDRARECSHQQTSPLGPTWTGHFFREPWYVMAVSHHITKCRGIFHPIKGRAFRQGRMVTHKQQATTPDI